MARNMKQQLFSVLLFLLILVSSSQPDQLLYSGFKNCDATNISLNGIAEIEKNGLLRLTNETSRLMGHAFYPSPFQVKDKTSGKVLSFSTSFALAIVPEYPKLGGHGLAFTIATSKDFKAHPSQYLGLFNPDDVGNLTNHRFAVEFDTVQDFEFDDINDNHVGIDINSLQSNASVNASYYLDDNGSGKLQDLNLKSGKPIMVWVDYDSVKNVLSGQAEVGDPSMLVLRTDGKVSGLEVIKGGDVSMGPHDVDGRVSKDAGSEAELGGAIPDSDHRDTQTE
ncbi:L-type lectin-domain containing receptor kinase S.4-like [Arachis stenosperma]|uniref:L-type lectin-domain containing receptor kinase S.4-like n=1 Tax=Arachis stenosperma TaxID=217475 RepID=UPI0025AC217D|nr:L-type lectin-domain containing receptor kinase S.4-like [Arachis stenosperma]